MTPASMRCFILYVDNHPCLLVGMTTEEIEELEKREDDMELEDKKKSRKNILLELENNFEKVLILRSTILFLVQRNNR